MKRLLVALLVGGIVFAAVFAVAAALNISSDDLGAGTTTVASCDTDGVTATYTVNYNATLAAYRVDTVTVTGIAAGCNGQSMKVSLTGPGASTASLGEVTATVTGTSQALNFVPANVKAEDVTGVHVVITG